MPLFLFGIAFLAALLGYQAFDTVSSFRTQMAKYNKSNFSYRDSRNGLNLFMADLEDVMRKEKLNTAGLLTGLKCKKNLDHASCDKLDIWKIKKSAPWMKRLSEPSLEYTDADGKKYLIKYGIPDNADSLGRLNVAVAVDKGSMLTWEQLQIFYPQMAGNGLSNAIVSEHVRCLFCHVTVFGNVAAYNTSEIHAPMNSRIHGALLFASQSTVAPTNHAESYEVGPHPTDTTAAPMKWGKQGLATYALKIHNLKNETSDALVELPTQTFSNTLSLDLAQPHANSFSSLSALDQSKIYDYSGKDSPDFYNDWFSSIYVRNYMDGYTGMNIPFNLRRQKLMLPKVDPVYAKSMAKGTLSAKLGFIVKAGGKFDSDVHKPGSLTITDIAAGHTYLRGTLADPIKIDGEIFVDGDLIISGFVSGTGSITSRLNTVIVSDIEYVNPPPHFNGTEASNKKMTLVSYRAADLAKEMTKYDRLALFAVKNIIVGSPFSYNQFPNFDTKYTQQALFTNYDLSFGYDAKNDEIYDIETVNGTECFLLPWQNLSDCRLLSDLPGVVKIKHLQTQAEYEAETGDNTKYGYYLYSKGHVESKAYKALFQPKWISQDDFYHLNNDTSKTVSFYTENAFREKEMLRAVLPLPNHGDLANYGDITGSEVINQIEAATGLITVGNTLAVDQNLGYTNSLSNRLSQFFELCMQSVRGDSVAGFRGAGAEILTNRFLNLHAETGLIKNFNFSNSIPMMYMDKPYIDPAGNTIQKTDMYCTFLYHSQTGESISDIGESGQSPVQYPLGGRNYLYSVGRSVCSDSIHGPYIGAEFSGGYAGGSCRKNLDGTNVVMPAETRDTVLAKSSLRITLRLVRPQIEITSMLWDTAKIKLPPKVQKIQSFLFANEFVFKNQPYVSDQTMFIHGGVVARELVGLFLSSPGKNAKNYKYAGTWEGSHLYDTQVSLWVTHDPRFMFVQDVPTGIRYFIEE